MYEHKSEFQILVDTYILSQTVMSEYHQDSIVWYRTRIWNLFDYEVYIPAKKRGYRLWNIQYEGVAEKVQPCSWTPKYGPACTDRLSECTLDGKVVDMLSQQTVKLVK